MPNIALIEALKKQPSDAQILYLGTRKGMEKNLVQPFGVKYRGIFCGKFRRYFSWKNIDILLFPIGIVQSFWSLKKFKPGLVFCKGGYVSLPVAIGAWLAHIPVLQDLLLWITPRSVFDEALQKNAAVPAKTNLGNLFKKALGDKKP